MPPILNEFMRHLKKQGRLPTFNGTYDFYKNEITEWLRSAKYMSRLSEASVAIENAKTAQNQKEFSARIQQNEFTRPLDLVDLLQDLGATSVAATA